MSGGILATAGMASSALTSQLWELYVTLGIIGGENLGKMLVE